MKREYKIELDGKSWCATNQDFINLQESIAGYGNTPMVALQNLISLEPTKLERIRNILNKVKTPCGRTTGHGESCIVGRECSECTTIAEIKKEMSIK